MAVKRSEKRIEVDGVKATATGAVVQTVHGMLPNIQLRFTTQDREEVVVNLTAYEASELGSQLIASLQAALPKIPRGAQRIPWE